MRRFKKVQQCVSAVFFVRRGEGYYNNRWCGFFFRLGADTELTSDAVRWWRGIGSVVYVRGR